MHEFIELNIILTYLCIPAAALFLAVLKLYFSRLRNLKDRKEKEKQRWIQGFMLTTLGIMDIKTEDSLWIATMEYERNSLISASLAATAYWNAKFEQLRSKRDN